MPRLGGHNPRHPLSYSRSPSRRLSPSGAGLRSSLPPRARYPVRSCPSQAAGFSLLRSSAKWHQTSGQTRTDHFGNGQASVTLTLDTYSHMLPGRGGEAADAIGEALG